VLPTIAKRTRYGITHLMVSPLECMQLPIECPLCGVQIYRFYVSNGSRAGARGLKASGSYTTHTRNWRPADGIGKSAVTR
jgi:hypothetical protein